MLKPMEEHHHLEHYFDHMAASFIDKECSKILLDMMKDPSLHANPSSHHPFGLKVKKNIENCTHEMIHALGGHKDAGIIWLQSASEAIATVIYGLASNYGQQKKHIITSTIEHQATFKALDKLKTQGFIIDPIDIDKKNGLIDLKALEAKISPNTLLVTTHHVNNETGTIQNIERICEIARYHGALSHLDCAQSIGKAHIDLKKIQPDFASFSAHKCFGPKGIGALYLNNRPKRSLTSPFSTIKAVDQNIKSGTLSLPLIASMSKAIVKFNSKENLKKNHQNLNTVKNHIIQALSQYTDIHINALSPYQVPHLISITLPKVSLHAIEKFKSTFNVSSFSACNQMQNSHVLEKLTIERKYHLKTLRICLHHHHKPQHTKKLIDGIIALTTMNDQ